MFKSRPQFFIHTDFENLQPFNFVSKGTDLSCLEKLHKFHGTHKNYIKPKSSATHAFGLVHFAGNVEYNINGFLEKNRDTFSGDLMQLIQTSNNKFLTGLFTIDMQIGSETRKRTPTLGAQFKRSLDSLMATLSACSPFFVRCIKPNEFKKAMVNSDNYLFYCFFYFGQIFNTKR